MTDHDIVDNTLEDRLEASDKYDLILKEHKYRIGKKYGECDLIGIRGKYAVVFEVKGRDKAKGRAKAYQQLRRDDRWIYERFPKVERVFNFYGYRKKQEVEVRWMMNL